MKSLLLTAMLISSSVSAEEGDNQPPPYSDMQGKRLSTVQCASVNLYHESRSESDMANVMIMAVMLNRVDDWRYPNTLCDVVFQRKAFSWTSDGKSDRIKDVKQYKRLYKIAENVLLNKEMFQGLSEGSTHYHTKAINPYWTKSRDMKYVASLDNHLFWRWEKK